MSVAPGALGTSNDKRNVTLHNALSGSFAHRVGFKKSLLSRITFELAADLQIF